MESSGFKNKKVLVFGLGILGGGIATVNWLTKQGAKVTITDLKSTEELEPSIKQIPDGPIYHLGGHSRKDIEDSDIVVVNPDVSMKNEFIAYARELGKDVENEATIFYDNFPGLIIGVTGTRGKTTTTLWANYIISAKLLSSIAGNSIVKPYLGVLGGAKLDIAITEIPSYHLELFPAHRAPDIAIVTNISPDHLNRHGSLEEYIRTKASLFKNQNHNHRLILNADDPNTPLLLDTKPSGRISYFSLKTLPKDSDGLYMSGNNAVFREAGQENKVLSLSSFDLGEHNKANLLAAALASYYAGCSWDVISEKISSLPQAPMRQELIYEDSQLKIINDTTATSPEGSLAAIRRFKTPSTIFIFGGTDRQLEFANWAHEVSRLEPQNIFFLTGSATDKMLSELKWTELQAYESLADCIRAALFRAKEFEQAMVVFSPGAKSFEKFKNEYDRGEQFNNLIKELLP